MATPDVRRAFASASDAFLAELATLRADELDRPATDAWSVRELVGHASRAYVAAETVLDTPVDPTTPDVGTAAGYFRAAFSYAGVHQGIEERARAAAAALGDAPLAYAAEAARRALPRIEATPDDHEVQHLVGRLAFGEYLATRVTELVLHTVDLQAALGRPLAAPPDAAAVVASLLVELSDRADPLALACVLAGRPWPGGIDVLR